jgi:hypothetical protein
VPCHSFVLVARYPSFPAAWPVPFIPWYYWSDDSITLYCSWPVPSYFLFIFSSQLPLVPCYAWPVPSSYVVSLASASQFLSIF